MNKSNKLQRSNFKVGIFGSSFNPLHLGHLNLLVQVQEKFDFDLIKVVPAYQNPLTSFIKEILPQKRLAVVRKVLQNYPFVEVDDREIKRGDISYTIDTIDTIQQENPSFKEIFLIMGTDQLVQFDQWKKFETIVEKVHLIVCSRKGYQWGASVVPSSLFKLAKPGFGDQQTKKKTTAQVNIRKQNILGDKARDKIELITGKNIYWLPLNNMDVSSSQIRKRCEQGLPINHLIPAAVSQWIEKYNLYQKKSVKEFNVPEMINFCIRTLLDKKAQKVRTFDLRQFSALPFDFTLVVSGLNTRHTKTMASHLHRQVKKRFSFCAHQLEGQENGEWIVLDYGSLVIHIFYDYTRGYYCLEELWKKAPVQEFSA